MVRGFDPVEMGFSMSETSIGGGREGRVGRNQSLFREFNERVLDTTNVADIAIWPASFICECANDRCFEHVNLSREEYESVRSNPRAFFVAPSEEHFIPAAERVLEKTDRFWVVEKMGEDAAVAEKFDPRSQADQSSLEFHPREQD
jgi:hypothetical protein